MKVLLDHNLPIQLRPLLLGHPVYTARELQWDRLKNGELLRIAEEEEFDVLITGDKNLSYQQNNARRAIALVVLSQTKRQYVLLHASKVLEAIERALPGSYELLAIGLLTPQTPAVE